MNWVILTVITFLGYGFVNLMFKVGERVGASIPVVTVSLYAFAAVFSASWFLYKKQLSFESLSSLDLKSLGVGISIAVFSIVGVIALQEALRVGKASLVAPIIALNSLVVILVSLLLFKEVITVKQVFGILLALAGVVLITSK